VYGTDKLRQVSISVKTLADCKKYDLDGSQICAGDWEPLKDGCFGDSGGPLLAKVNNQYVAMGVVR
jgi:secreted trypsin-like serine protease